METPQASRSALLTGAQSASCSYIAPIMVCSWRGSAGSNADDIQNFKGGYGCL